VPINHEQTTIERKEETMATAIPMINTTVEDAAPAA
jgi:hypothetical protein